MLAGRFAGGGLVSLTFLALLDVLLDIFFHGRPVVVAGDLLVGLVESEVSCCVVAVMKYGFADTADVGDAETVFEVDAFWCALKVELREAVDVLVDFLEVDVVFVGFADFLEGVVIDCDGGDVGDMFGFVVVES